jgi:hypothetical protein
MVESIIREIDQHIRGLQLARKILSPVDVTRKKPVGSIKRVISPEGRANMVAAQKRRWAKAKRSA